jgi:hypothetical protein
MEHSVQGPYFRIERFECNTGKLVLLLYQHLAGTSPKPEGKKFQSFFTTL